MDNINIASGNAHVGSQSGHAEPLPVRPETLVGGRYTWGVGVEGGHFFGRVLVGTPNRAQIHASHRFTPGREVVAVNRVIELRPDTLRNNVRELPN